MATFFDNLITRYAAVDSYTGPVGRMIGVTERFVSAFTTATVALGAATAGLGKFALDAATEYDTFSRKIEAFTGSAEKAAQTLRFIRDLSGPSLFEFRDLAKAGTLLAAYGLNIERTLPMAEAIATAMGDDAEAVSEVARALGRLKSGDFGEAFERLRDFGISREDLQARGLEFDRGGRFLGSAQEALSAVEDLVREKFGRIRDLMNESPAARFSSAMDALRNAARAAGTELLQVVVPAVQKFSQFVSFLTEGGFVQDFAKNFTRALESLGEVLGGEGGFTRVGAFLFAFFERLPSLLAKAVQAFKSFLTSTGDLFTGALNQLIDSVNSFIEQAERIANMGARLLGRDPVKLPRATPFQGIGDYVSRLMNASPFGDEFSEIGKRADEIFEKFQFFKGRPEEGFPGPSGEPFFGGGNSTLQQIEDNTRKTAEHTKSMLDLRRYVVGGGPLSDIGVTPVELGGARASRKGLSINMSGVGREAEAFVESVAQKVVFELARSGMLRGAAGH